jgi:hypothetical protein
MLPKVAGQVEEFEICEFLATNYGNVKVDGMFLER